MEILRFYLLIGCLLAFFVNTMTDRKELVESIPQRIITTLWIIGTWFLACIYLYLREMCEIDWNKRSK